jgi:photosystem II stability/assembly factor-like uncharacterized protein
MIADKKSGLVALTALLLVNSAALSQRDGKGRPPRRAIAPRTLTVQDTAAFQTLEWRSIGPYRGGRVSTVTGVVGNPQVYYMGANGGGVWKTVDAGTSWFNISDRYFEHGSIGYIAVAPTDSATLYVGTGEASPRGQMSSFGDGMYTSADAGHTWKHIGLEKSRQISKILIDPRDKAVVYVAALGNRWEPSDDRGIYRSRDGGVSWQRILFVDRSAGAIDMAMAPNDPNVIYAAFWDFQRSP